LAPGEHGDGVEAPKVPIGATIVAARDAEVGVPETPSTNWSARSVGEVLIDGTAARLGGAMWRIS
jgi:hypothetical protein